MGKNPEQLTCLSIVICDEIYRDEQSKKLIIVGAFNNIWTPIFPCKHRLMSVLFTLTNGRGKYDLSLSIEHENTGESVVEIRGPLTMANPRAILDTNVQLGEVPFQEEGRYWVVLKADGEIVQQRPFLVSLRPQPESSGE